MAPADPPPTAPRRPTAAPASTATGAPPAPATAPAPGASGPSPLPPESVVAVAGTGTMGRGIAQVALVAGHPVLLYDAVPGRAAEAARAVAARLDRLVEKGRLTPGARDAARARLGPVAGLPELAGAALVVEAIAEDAEAKRALFAEVEKVVGEDCLLATNTSSLPVTAVASALRHPGRLVGLHFFNPAPLLPLVEVVSGFATGERVAARAHATAAAWGKTPVRCADTPGFIVNRVARPFYAEAFRVYEERAADPATLDAVLRESGGFRMGPFELTDLIGQDVNEAVTRSVWESFFRDPKFTPSLAQRRLVESGLHGRKSGRGWYAHGERAEPPTPHTAPPGPAPARVAVHGDLGPAAALCALMEEAGLTVVRAGSPGGPDPSGRSGSSGETRPAGPAHGYLELPGSVRLALTDGGTATGRRAATEAAAPAAGGGGGAFVPPPVDVVFDLALDYRTATRIALAPAAGAAPGAVEAAAGLFQALGKQVSVIGDVPGLIVARTVAMLVDFAADAAGRGVAAAADVDTAMRLGVNYPRGPLEWGDALGAAWVRAVLDRLHHAYPTGRYAPSPWLLRRAAAGENLLES
ncbi:3-hydroxyacyl-CoA dehydrogenase [Streptomyces zingiberis]|uniref:3-hydroxyacyl-CoA dehydrogenase n=1 Tax=Streptomyces zingiberis TaxID=2053010 RepID=A0ABX1BNI9_9ACTN|nr:3-hydroxyacyl-CoA dehydrogenase [Streptomyces zingiberis]NJP99281.1 3-hydroxyacyl-CoA dehydrogenase [Streptomyces zingiberis]